MHTNYKILRLLKVLKL